MTFQVLRSCRWALHLHAWWSKSAADRSEIHWILRSAATFAIFFIVRVKRCHFWHILKGLNCMYIIESISWCKDVVFPDVLKDSWSAAHLRPPQVCYLCVSLLWMFLLCSTLLKNIRLWRAMCPPPEKKQSANFHFFSFTLLWLSFFLRWPG